MNEQLFSGCGVALATPFRAGEVDYPALGALIERQIASGVDALILCGTTGEPSTLTPEEQRGVWETGLRQARGRVTVLAGTGGNHTREVIEQSLLAQSLGVDGLLLVTPYYNKTTQEGLIAHFSRVADAVRLPIILYNVPGRTGLNMRPETAARLCAHPRILGVKEACGDISQAAELMRLCPNAAVYSGNDDQTLPMMAMRPPGAYPPAAADARAGRQRQPDSAQGRARRAGPVRKRGAIAARAAARDTGAADRAVRRARVNFTK